MIGFGEVRHARLRPARNRFACRTYFLMLPMRSLRAAPDPVLRRNRFGLIGFFDRDHGDGRADSLAWLDDLLAAEHIADADGEVWLHCYPRVLGHTFKPVSFWYCHRADRTLAAIVVEVNNTFGERHCYLLAGNEVAFGRELQASKVFHVSPFCQTSGSYRFRFMSTGLDAGGRDLPPRPNPDPDPLPYACLHPHAQPASEAASSPAPTRARTIATIDHHDDAGLLIRTSISGRLQPLTPASIRHAFFGMPLMTFGIVARIHWQALKLWLKQVPFVRKPPLPTHLTTR